MPRRSAKGTFDVRQTASLTGLSAYMVDYLCRSGTFLPTGSSAWPGRRGVRRYYTFADVVFLRGIAKLLKYGLPVSKLGAALRALRRRKPGVTITSLPARYLVTDGKKVYLSDRGSVEDVNTRQLAFAFVLELQQLQTHVRKKAKRLGWLPAEDNRRAAS